MANAFRPRAAPARLTRTARGRPAALRKAAFAFLYGGSRASIADAFVVADILDREVARLIPHAPGVERIDGGRRCETGVGAHRAHRDSQLDRRCLMASRVFRSR